MTNGEYFDTRRSSVSFFLAQEHFVLGCVHECIQIGEVAGLDLHHPATIKRLLVDEFGRAGDRFVDLDHLAADGRKDIRGGFDRLDDTEGDLRKGRGCTCFLDLIIGGINFAPTNRQQQPSTPGHDMLKVLAVLPKWRNFMWYCLVFRRQKENPVGINKVVEPFNRPWLD